jgi:hypothetical protein
LLATRLAGDTATWYRVSNEWDEKRPALPAFLETRGSSRREAGVLSPNDVRIEEGWPASSDPTADSIEPPTAGGPRWDSAALQCPTSLR